MSDPRSAPGPAGLNAGLSAPRIILLGVDLGPNSPFDPTLDELALLAQSAGDEPVAKVTAKRRAPDPAFFVGSGKADEIKQLVVLYQAQRMTSRFGSCRTACAPKGHPFLASRSRP